MIGTAASEPRTGVAARATLLYLLLLLVGYSPPGHSADAAFALFGTVRTAASPSRNLAATGSSASAVAPSASASSFASVELRYAEYPARPSSSSSDPHDPVIILHGLLGSKRNFASLASSLSSQLRRPRLLVTLDLRNHGENDPITSWSDDMSYPSMASDVIAVMDELGMERAVLVGHSMGGKVAAAASLLFPDRVSGLVVLDIAPVRYRPESDAAWGAVVGSVEAIANINLAGEKKGEEASVEGGDGGCTTKRDVDRALRPALEDPALRAFVLTNLDQPRKRDDDAEGRLRWKVNVAAIRDQLDVLAGFDLHPSGEEDSDGETRSELLYSGDVFIISGGMSRFVQQSHLDEIRGYFPNYMVTSIRGAGHWVHAEAPDDTVALLKRYLDR